MLSSYLPCICNDLSSGQKRDIGHCMQDLNSNLSHSRSQLVAPNPSSEPAVPQYVSERTVTAPPDPPSAGGVASNPETDSISAAALTRDGYIAVFGGLLGLTFLLLGIARAFLLWRQNRIDSKLEQNRVCSFDMQYMLLMPTFVSLKLFLVVCFPVECTVYVSVCLGYTSWVVVIVNGKLAPLMHTIACIGV